MRLDLARVGRIGRKRAGLEDLARGPAEDLVVRRDDLEVAERRDAQLHGRRSHSIARDPLLDDAARLRDLRREAIPAHVARLERKIEWHVRVDPAALVARRAARVGEHRVALARKAVVELQRGTRQRRVARLELGKRLDHVLDAAEVLPSVRQRDTRFAKRRAAPALATQVLQRRIATVERDAEPHGQRALEGRHVEARKMRQRRIAHRIADALEQSRPLEDLLRERRRRRVAGRQQHQPLSRLVACDSREQPEVIVHDRALDRRAAHEHDARVRQPEQHQHRELALLVVQPAQHLRQHVLVHGQARHDHDGAWFERVREDATEQVGQPRLKPLVGSEFLGAAGRGDGHGSIVSHRSPRGKPP